MKFMDRTFMDRKKKKICSAGLVVALSVSLAGGVGVGPAGRPVVTEAASAKSTSISLSVAKAKLTVGDTLTLKVKGKKISGKAKWKTSKKSVATVSKKGVVKAKKAGTAKITVTVGKTKAACKINVKKAAVKTVIKKVPVSTETTENSNKSNENSSSKDQTETKEADGNKILTLWNDNAAAKQSMISYMEAITKEGSKDYIPVEDRIAVFDLDGTLFCETDPNYFDYTLLHYRVLEDPDYKDKASDFEKEVAQKIDDQNKNGTSYDNLATDHGKAVASAFKGMTLKEFNDYIQEFKKQEMPSYTGMKRGEGFYKPMLQIIDYLKANDFTVYVVSGTDRFIVRGIVDQSALELPNRQLIGSDELLVATGQGETDGLDYTFKDSDSLVLGGEFLIKNLKTNKVTVIMQEIGQQPVLSFGNSTGDSSMAEFVTSGNPYKSLAFMLCCDDTVRENGSVEKADKMKKLCEEYDWVPVSMKDDWTTIYGDGVKKK